MKTSTIQYVRKYWVSSKRRKYIAFLQETHLVDKEHMKLRRDWVGQACSSSFTSSSRGVSVLIHTTIPIVLITCTADPEDRYIHGTIYGTHITTMNIYTPNSLPPSFWTGVATELEECRRPLTVLGGDLNFCLDNKLDRCPTNIHKTTTEGAPLVKMLDDINLELATNQ